MPAALAGPPPAETIPPAPACADGPCDASASGAEDAQVTITRGSAELRLCGHHYAACELALAADGWRITHDDRPAPAKLSGDT